jgi:hypothetical protein
VGVLATEETTKLNIWSTVKVARWWRMSNPYVELFLKVSETNFAESGGGNGLLASVEKLF